MKRLLASFLILLSLSVANAANFVTATLTVTNGTTNGQTFTLNGVAHTWTNSVSSASTQILTNSTIGGAATNLFNHFGSYGGVPVQRSGTNAVIFYGSGLTVSISSGWASLALSTNVSTNNYGVFVPMRAAMTTTNATNVASLLVTDLNTLPANSLSQTSTVLAEVVGLTNTQTATGVKTFSGANVYSNSNQRFVGGSLTNVSLYATSGTLSGVKITGSTNTLSTLTNVSIINSSISGTVTATNSFQLNVYDEPNDATNIFDFTVSDESGSSNTPIRLLNLNTNQFGTEPTFITTSRAVWIKDGASVTNLTGSSSNFVHKGTNQYTGDIAFSRYDITSLANGNNAAVNPGTNVYLKVSGPTTNFTINGISGGRDGRRLYIQNSTGYQMTIANDSGVDPTAANRILTGVGGDLVMSNNPTFLAFTYDSAANRWIVQTFSGSVTVGEVGGGSGSQSPLTNNVDGNSYSITNLSNLTVTNKFTNSTLTASALVASDGNKALKSVTIGSGLSYDGATLSASGGSQTPLTSDIDGAVTNSITNLSSVNFAFTNENSLNFRDILTATDSVKRRLMQYRATQPTNHVIYLGDGSFIDAVSLAVKNEGAEIDPRITFVFGEGDDQMRRTWRFHDQFIETGFPYQDPEDAPRIFQHDGYGNAAIPRQMKITTNSITAPAYEDPIVGTNLTQLSIIGRTGDVFQFEYHIYVQQFIDSGCHVYLTATNSPTYVRYTMSHVASDADTGAKMTVALDDDYSGSATDSYMDFCIKGTVKFSGSDCLFPVVALGGIGDPPIVLEGSSLKAVKHFQAPSVYSPTAYVAP